MLPLYWDQLMGAFDEEHIKHHKSTFPSGYTMFGVKTKENAVFTNQAPIHSWTGDLQI